jgi:hypothetical protein
MGWGSQSEEIGRWALLEGTTDRVILRKWYTMLNTANSRVGLTESREVRW